MGILKNKTFWVMLFIVVLGTLLRLIFIDKPDGLWNDEYVSWAVASIPFGKNFINAVLGQCHMPLYYLYIKFFVHFFGNNDIMLRLTSLVPGVFAIIAMYFAGKEIKDNKLGILCAAIAALSSFLIYFSQEVRFYELLFLFSALLLIFTVRLGKTQTSLNFAMYVLSNLLIILTHTIGFVFVLLNMMFMSHWLLKTAKKYKKLIAITWVILFLALTINIPLILRMFTHYPFAQWWDHFSFAKIGFLLTDYFSPILINLVSSPDNFFYNFTFGFLIFGLLSTIIAIAGIVKALRTKKYEILGLFYLALAFVIFLIIFAISGKLVFLTKYSIEIYPILIVIAGFGLLEFKKELRVFLIFSFCFLNLFYILITPTSAPKMHRAEGHKIVANLLKSAKLQDGDFILLNYYPKERFEKYFNFSKYKVLSINKNNFTEYLGMDFNKSLKNGNAEYKNIFTAEENPTFKNKFNAEVITQLKAKQKLAIVILNDVAIYSPTKMLALTSSKEYNKAPFFFLVFSQLRNEELKQSLKELKISRIEQKGSWTVITFIK